jgi:hypothetical protein
LSRSASIAPFYFFLLSRISIVFPTVWKQRVCYGRCTQRGPCSTTTDSSVKMTSIGFYFMEKLGERKG